MTSPNLYVPGLHVSHLYMTQNQNREIANLFERERLQREKEEREIQRICEVSLKATNSGDMIEI